MLSVGHTLSIANPLGKHFGLPAVTDVPGVQLSTNPVISFSNNSGFSDNIASDGEGGSVPITDFDINILPINSSGTKLTGSSLEFHDGNDWSGYPAIITYGSVNPLYGWSIRSGNGAEFNFKGIDAHDWGNWEGGTTFVLQAFRDGTSLGSITFGGNIGGAYVELREGDQLTSIFQNVDEVRMYQQGGYVSYISLNNVQVGPAEGAPAPSITSNPPNRTICALSNTSFSVTATNTTSYQWQVNTGSGYNDITNGGIYSGAASATLTLTGVTAGMNGYLYRCTAGGSGTATSNAGTLTISNINMSSYSQTNVSCNGGSNGSASVTPSGGISPYTYSWSPSGGTAYMATGLAVNTYTVTVTDNIGCTATKSFTITQPAAFSVTTSKTDVSCNGGSNGTATVSVSGGTPSYTYSWSPSGGTSATATGLAAGTYTCTITDANSCQTTKTFTINQPTAMSVSGSKTDVSCNGGSNGTATVSVSGGTPSYTYSWSPSGGINATATGLAAGTYTCTITDANSCQTTKTFTINQPTAMSVSGSKTDVSCNGGSNGTATVSVSGGTPSYTYSWSPSGGTSATATGLAAGTYTCTITDANSCQTTKTFTINQPVAFSVTTSKTDVSCNGGSNGTATVTVSGATAPYSYSWSPSGGTAATASGLAAGTYTVTITDNNTCQTTRSFTINQPTALTAGISKTDVSCNSGSNGTATVSASGGTPGYTYSWSPSGGTNATATGLASGTYTCTITDANSCQITRSVTISQPTAFSISTSKTDVSCNGGSNGTATVTVSGATAPYSYSWAPSGGTAATASGLASGTYTVTITDNNTCQTTRSFTITQPPALTVTATPSSATICSGGSTGIALSSVPSGADFSWTASIVSGTVSGALPSSGSSIDQTLTGSGVVKYTITPDNGTCTGTPVEISVTVNALTVITSHPSDSNIDEDENTSFTVEAQNATGYQWQVDQAEGFVNISNDEVYSGAATATLAITHATGSMDGYAYRCVATGNCVPVTSNSATLSVSVRTPQIISFGPMTSAVYGDADIDPGAVSNAGLTITYSSSDENVASIVNGKIHIKKAGQTTITATQSGNNDYKPASPVQQTFTITKKQITVSLNASPVISKAYDGNNNASLAAGNYSLSGIEEGDGVYVSGTAVYGSATAGSGKPVTVTGFVLGGSDKDNYDLTTGSAQVAGAIIPKEVTVTLNASPAISKTYDGNTSVVLTAANYSIHGVVGEDELSVSGPASYDNKNAGDEKAIYVTALVLDGADKNNYQVVTTSVQTTGEIKAKSITLTLNPSPVISKQYDGEVSATLGAGNYVLSGVEEGDDLSVSGTAVYDDKNAGSGKTVTANGFILSGTDKANYTLTTLSATTTGGITARTLTVSLQAQPTVTKQYDGNTAAVIAPANYVISGIAGEDEVLLNNPEAGIYDNKHGGEGKTVTVSGLEISGPAADNYVLEATTISGDIGIITKKAIEVTAAPQTKLYSEADPELTYTSEGKLPEDELPGALQRTEGKNAGSYQIEQGSLSGGDDYIIESFEGATFTITPSALVITADNKTKKQGAANPEFTFSYDGLAQGDQPADLEAGASAVTNASAGSPIGNYDIVVSGASSENYTISYVKGTLTVTPAQGEDYSVKAWSSSPDVLQVRIYTTVAQKASIILFTEVGQQVILELHQLSAGLNSFSVPVGRLASSTYVLSVVADKFKDAQKVKIK